MTAQLFRMTPGFTGWRFKSCLLLFASALLVLSYVWLGTATRHVLLREKSPNSNWVNRRHELQAASNLTKVLMFAYARGGSSFGGELYNQDPGALLWYEPLDAFYSAHYGTKLYTPVYRLLYGSHFTRRTLGSTEEQLLISYINNMLECRLDDLPAETLLHPFFGRTKAMNDLLKCLWQKPALCKQKYSRCINPLGSLCGASREMAIQNNCPEYIRNSTGGVEVNKTVNRNAKRTFMNHRKCFDRLQKVHLTPCMPLAHRACANSNIRVLKILRMHMSEVEKVIEANPDAYVIYYTRDPRAISRSRSKASFLSWTGRGEDPVQESRYLCTNMRSDIAAMEALKDRYPGVFLHVKYEDLVEDPVGTSRYIYEFFGRTQPPSWETYAKKVMFAKKNGDRFSVYRTNASEVADKWRDLAYKSVQAMNANCGDVLQNLHYAL